MQRRMFTESMARACALHPWRTIGLWAALIIVAFLLSNALLSDALTTQFRFTNNPDSQRANDLVEERLRGPKRATELVIVQSETLTVDDTAFRERVETLFEIIMAVGPTKVGQGLNYYQFNDPSMVSEDRRTSILTFEMAGTLDDAISNAKELLAIAKMADGEDNFRVLIAGEASVTHESNELATSDIKKGESIGVPVALIILLVLFGAVLAAVLPLLLAIVAIIVALGATAIVGQAFDLVFFVTLMISMIGLAVGIDYSLLIVYRFREELPRQEGNAVDMTPRSGVISTLVMTIIQLTLLPWFIFNAFIWGRKWRPSANVVSAVGRTGATASRTVFFSGLIVVMALAGMLIIPTTIFRSLGVGAILVVVSAVLASLTLLPAVLSLLGHRINALKIPFLGRSLNRDSAENTGGFWAAISNTVMRFPAPSLIITAGLLILAAFSYFDINTGFNGVDTLPDRLQTKQAFVVLEEEFSFGVVAPAQIVIDGPVFSAEVEEARQRLEIALANDPETFPGDNRWLPNNQGDLGLLAVPLAGDPNGEIAIDAIRKLREELIPQAFAGVDADVLVGGTTAFSVDFFAVSNTYAPIVVFVVLALSFILLMLVFRSIVVPIKAIIMNLFSVGAAYGLLVLVFQKGFLDSILPFQQTPIIDAWIPLFLFSVLFGLSMDYHVFLLSRIRERYDQTRNNTEAVAFGLRATGGLITGAAMIMVVVFSGFASGESLGNQQVGFGLAAAIFIDATIVRSIMVPASMRLLGNVNWYLPSFLRWLPDLRVEPHTEPSLVEGERKA